MTGDDEMSIEPVRMDDVFQKEIDLRRESFPDAEITVSGDIPEVEVTANEMIQDCRFIYLSPCPVECCPANAVHAEDPLPLSPDARRIR